MPAPAVAWPPERTRVIVCAVDANEEPDLELEPLPAEPTAHQRRIAAFEEAILGFLRDEGVASARDAAAGLGVSSSAAWSRLRALQARGQVVLEPQGWSAAT